LNAEEKQATPQGSLLVVDDIEMNRDLLSRRFGLAGYNVTTAETGVRALELIDDGGYDLVLLDIMMPEMDGIKVLKVIRETRSMVELPVIMVSALTDSADIVTALELGANDYVGKPVNFQEALARTRTQIELKRLSRELKDAREAADRATGALDIANRLIRQTFGRYLSDDLVDEILGSPEGAALGGASCIVTIMMSDLRGFTAFSEELPAESLMRLLNIYLKEMTGIILRYRGTIIEFIGDSIFAIFGAPLRRDDDAERAVSCAVEMQAAMDKINRQFNEMGFPEVEQGIGLNTGELVVGNLGSDKRTKYGAVGRDVNLTARIESYALGGQILVSESTLAACGPILRVDHKMKVRPKGVKTPITIYEVGGIGGGFNRYLPEKRQNEMVELSRSLSARFSIFDGKHATEEIFEGIVAKLGPDAATIYNSASVERWINIKISILDTDTQETAADLYGKITECDSKSAHTFKVHFTYASSAAKTAIAEFINRESIRRNSTHI